MILVMVSRGRFGGRMTARRQSGLFMKNHWISPTNLLPDPTIPRKKGRGQSFMPIDSRNSCNYCGTKACIALNMARPMTRTLLNPGCRIAANNFPLPANRQTSGGRLTASSLCPISYLNRGDRFCRNGGVAAERILTPSTRARDFLPSSIF